MEAKLCFVRLAGRAPSHVRIKKEMSDEHVMDKIRIATGIGDVDFVSFFLHFTIFSNNFHTFFFLSKHFL